MQKQIDDYDKVVRRIDRDMMISKYALFTCLSILVSLLTILNYINV